MNEELEPAPAAAAWTIGVSPAEIDAGAEVTIVASAPGDLSGASPLSILDAAGDPLGRLTFMFDGGSSPSDPLVVAAPRTAGTHRWQAVAEDGSPVGFEVNVRAHRPGVVVWNVSPTIPAKGTFRATIGVKCSAGCDPTGWPLIVEDHEGNDVATASVGGTPAPGTDGLHAVELELTAPEAEGLYAWRARIAPEADLPHDERAASFKVRVVPAPEILLRVEAWDQEAGAPISRAKVVVHPYRAVTDADGIAELRLPKGDYTIFVSGRKHIPFRRSGPVTEDTTIRAELYIDQGLSDADIWA